MELTPSQIDTLLRWVNMTDQEFDTWSNLKTKEEVKQFLNTIEPLRLKPSATKNKEQ